MLFDCEINFKKYKKWNELQKKGKEYAVEYHMNIVIQAEVDEVDTEGKKEAIVQSKLHKVVEKMFWRFKKVGTLQYYNPAKDELIKDFEFIIGRERS